MDSTEKYFSFVPVTFSSNMLINNIKQFDSTVEIVGYIDEFVDIKTVVKRKQKVFFQFYLNNGSGHRVQVKVCEDEQIKRIKPFIIMNAIIHLDGVKAKQCDLNCNRSTIQFELCIQDNTIINCFGLRDPEYLSRDSTSPTFYKIKDLRKSKGQIKTEGYVKTCFEKVEAEEFGKVLFLCGSITDSVHKVEVKIQCTENDSRVEKGQKVEITGVMNFEGFPYLKVISTDDIIKKNEQKMPFKKLLEGTRNIKKYIEEIQ